MKVLYFYPFNPLDVSQGNNIRAFELLKYFKSRNFLLDFVGESYPFFNNSQLTVLKEKKLINNGYLLPRSKKSGINYLLKMSLPRLLSGFPSAFDRRRLNQQKLFNEVLNKNEYDYIIISYSCWIPLIKGNPYLKNAKVIVDTHDFLTSQFQNNRKFNLGNYFETEIKLLGSVDPVWAISTEEKYIYEQFLKNTVDLVPHTSVNEMSKAVTKDIDIVYVASDNDHNKKGAIWFFEEVYPKLSTTLKITVVGNIVDIIPCYINLTKLKKVEDLTPLYNRSKISLCPMFSGTGLKIKVVEALSHGIPVVCNERGVDGLLNKTNNGCLVTNSSSEFSGFIKRLLSDMDYYNLQSLKAKAFYEESLSQSHVYKKLDSIFCL